MKNIILLAILALTAAAVTRIDNTTGSLKVNDGISRAYWKGSARDHYHVGSFKVTGVLRTTKSGVIETGDFSIPISSIEDFDLPANVKPGLLGHLQSKDFFNVALHPSARFHLTGAYPYRATGDTSVVAGANYLLTGDFSMVGKTRAVTFPAKVTVTADSVLTEAKFKLDRTNWGMNSFTDSSAKLYIYPDVNIRLDIRAGKN